jgi:hypothetical protein
MTKPLRLFEEHRAPEHDPQLFGRTPEDAFDDPGLTFADKTVLGVLAFFAMNSYPNVTQKQTAIARKCALTPRGLRGILGRLQERGYLERSRDYSRRGAPHVIKLKRDFRTPFRLTSDALSTRPKSASNRKSGSGCNRKGGSDCNRKGGSGATLFRDLERENPRPPSPRVEVPATSDAAESGPKPLSCRPITSLDFARLCSIGDRHTSDGPTAEAMAARAELRRLDGLGLLGSFGFPDFWDGPRQGNEPAAGSSAKIPPRPAGASISRCEPLYPEEHKQPKS